MELGLLWFHLGLTPSSNEIFHGKIRMQAMPYSSFPGYNGHFNFRIMNMSLTGEDVSTFKKVYYIEILDLEPNPANRLAMESYPKDPVFYQCPHHIISNIAG